MLTLIVSLRLGCNYSDLAQAQSQAQRLQPTQAQHQKKRQIRY